MLEPVLIGSITYIICTALLVTAIRSNLLIDKMNKDYLRVTSEPSINGRTAYEWYKIARNLGHKEDWEVKSNHP